MKILISIHIWNDFVLKIKLRSKIFFLLRIIFKGGGGQMLLHHSVPPQQAFLPFLSLKYTTRQRITSSNILITLYFFVMTESSGASSSGFQPCHYRGTPISHGDSLQVDQCTTCSCDNGVVDCDIIECPTLSCDKPIVYTGECCPICPQGKS